MSKKTILNKIGDVPSHFECNPHVLGGYRPFGRSWAWYAASAVSWHNETVNAATMFVGLVFFLDCLDKTRNPAVLAFAVSGAVMFAFSTAYHVFWPRGPLVYAALLLADHSCIVVSVGGYAYPLAAMVFGRESSAFVFYSIVSFAVTARNVARVATGKLDTRRRLYVSAATAWFVPAIGAHALAFGGDLRVFRDAVVVGVLYPAGAILYATRFPDRLLPGWFDYVGSHEIMHACVLTAAVTHLKMFRETLP
jgi:adiponectin receptor